MEKTREKKDRVQLVATSYAITFTMDADVYEKFQSEASERRVDMGAVLKQAVEEWFEERR